MFPAGFDYHRAESVSEAQRTLAEHEADGTDARLLAGGQGLVPSMKLGDASPDVLVDVRGVDALAGVSVDDQTATVGALTTHAEVAGHDGLEAAAPVLVATARHTADRQVRNRGTLGGNLAEANPAADPPAAVVAAGSALRIRGPDGERTVPVTAFFAGDGDTDLGDRDVLIAVDVPRHDAGAYAKFTHPASGYAAVGVAVALDVRDGRIDAAGVAATGAVDPVQRLDAVEDAIQGTVVDAVDVEAAASQTTVPEALLVGDAHASASYRGGVLSAYVERALNAAISDLRGTRGGDR